MWLPRKRRSRDYTLRFNDHTDTPALMVFKSHEGSALPPLYDFVIYFTHPETNISDIEPTAMDFLRTIDNNSYDFRLDMHFLQGASDEECIAHYEAEFAVRGPASVQLATLEAPDEELVHAPGGLPGLVPSYFTHVGLDFYTKFIFVVPTRDWRNEGQRLRFVEFGAISEEEYQRYMKECEEEVDGPLARVSSEEVWLKNEDMAKYSSITRGMGDVYNPMANVRVGRDLEEVDAAWSLGQERKWQTWPVRKV